MRARGWGSDAHGKSTPPAAAFRQVAADGQRSCGIKADGSVACDFGQAAAGNVF